MRAPDDERSTDDLVGRKAGLRDVVRARDTAFAPVRSEISGAIVAHLAASDRWQAAGCAMAYLAMRSEVDLEGLWNADPRPTLCVPRVDPETGSMSACTIGDPATESEPGVFGVRSPVAAAAAVEPGTIGLVLVPGLAFDISGNRLGRGGGYYDRFLAPLLDANPGVTLIGVCWSGRVVASVPVGPSDVRVGMLVTEHGLERCRG